MKTKKLFLFISFSFFISYEVIAAEYAKKPFDTGNDVITVIVHRDKKGPSGSKFIQYIEFISKNTNKVICAVGYPQDNLFLDAAIYKFKNSFSPIIVTTWNQMPHGQIVRIYAPLKSPNCQIKEKKSNWNIDYEMSDETLVFTTRDPKDIHREDNSVNYIEERWRP